MFIINQGFGKIVYLTTLILHHLDRHHGSDIKLIVWVCKTVYLKAIQFGNQHFEFICFIVAPRQKKSILTRNVDGKESLMRKQGELFFIVAASAPKKSKQ